MQEYLPDPEKKGAGMGDDDLLALLNELEDDAKDYVHGALANAREIAMREYYQQPYETDDMEDGLSKFVTSEVQDTIEWILPSLAKMFTAGENAVEFEPRRQQDEEGAMQATEACNYVFYSQNNGFLVLLTALKDALQLRGGPLHWYWEEREILEKQRFRALTLEELSYTLQQLKQDAGEKGEVEIIAAEPANEAQVDEMGNIIDPARFAVQIQIKKTQGKVVVDPFEPENLLVVRDWHSPLLERCPYICRLKKVTLSDLAELGFDVDAGDLGNEDIESSDRDARNDLSGDETTALHDRTDESMRTGWLRYEYVLVDFDGDGIAERRRILRLGGRILENEECDHVPIANLIPILRQHRWDGLSLADTMSDLQRLKTEITRMALNSMYLTIMPRARVLTDQSGVPLVNVDDMLSNSPGTNIREKQAGAYQPIEQTWLGGQVLPLIQYVDGMKENRSGVGQYFTGNTENALNKTASGTQQLVSQAQQRVELIARMAAETGIRPMFQGIFKLLTEYQMEPIAFRLRGKYVEYDPMEWRDAYGMVINVGLGNNNKDQTLGHLVAVEQMMARTEVAPNGAGTQGPIVTPRGKYEVIKRTLVNMGFKQHEAFVNDPGDPQPPQQPPPPPEIVKTQMTLQADAQKTQATTQADANRLMAEQDFEARKIMADQAHQKEMAVLQAQLADERARNQKLLTDDSELQRIAVTQAHDLKRALMTAKPDLAKDIADGGEEAIVSVGESIATLSEQQATIAEAVRELVEQKASPVSVQIMKDAKGKVIGAVASKGATQTQIDIQRP